MNHQPSRHAPALALLLSLAAPAALAHVPFLETADYTQDQPFLVRDVAQSKALYGWLDSAADVDFYAMEIEAPARIYTRTLVPMCAEYQDFAVHYALIGPGMPAPVSALPVELPPGYGAIVMLDARATVAARPTLYEQFSARYYFEGPELEYEAAVPGEYRMVVWSEGAAAGDYVAVIGRAEKFGAADIWRAARHTPTLRRGGELHSPCTAPADQAQAQAAAD